MFTTKFHTALVGFLLIVASVATAQQRESVWDPAYLTPEQEQERLITGLKTQNKGLHNALIRTRAHLYELEESIRNGVERNARLEAERALANTEEKLVLVKTQASKDLEAAANKVAQMIKKMEELTREATDAERRAKAATLKSKHLNHQVDALEAILDSNVEYVYDGRQGSSGQSQSQRTAVTYCRSLANGTKSSWAKAAKEAYPEYTKYEVDIPSESVWMTNKDGDAVPMMLSEVAAKLGCRAG